MLGVKRIARHHMTLVVMIETPAHQLIIAIAQEKGWS